MPVISPKPVTQSGTVTPRHLAEWTTDGVIMDSGIPASGVTGGLVVTDGTHTVNNVGTVDFTDGAVVTQLGTGIAGVSIGLVLTDGTTTVSNVGTVDFLSNATISSLGTGTAGVEINVSTSPITVTDGITTISNVTTIDYTYGAIVTAGSSSAIADIAINDASFRMQLQWSFGAVVSNGVGYFCYAMPYDGTIDFLTYFTGNDSFVVAVAINGVPVTGLTGITVNSSTPLSATATANNVFSAGNKVTGTISSTSGSPTNALLMLIATWTK